jgi:hypothetical protein
MISVVVSRDVPGWQAEAGGAELARRVTTLAALDQHIRDQYGEDVEFDVHTGDAELDQLLRTIRAARKAARLIEEQVASWTQRALAHPRMLAMPSRDAGVVLDLSHQRVHQIRQAKGIGDAYRCIAHIDQGAAVGDIPNTAAAEHTGR